VRGGTTYPLLGSFKNAITITDNYEDNIQDKVFIYCLFNGAVGMLRLYSMMINEYELRMWKTTKEVRQNIWYPGQELNMAILDNVQFWTLYII
jgi:hypothetical protein